MIATTFIGGISPWSRQSVDDKKTALERLEKQVLDLLLARPGANVPALALCTHKSETQLRLILRDMFDAGKVERVKTTNGHYRYWIRND